MHEPPSSAAVQLHLLNGFMAGDDDPWSDADWSASWTRASVDDAEWAALREQLRIEAQRWRDSLARADNLEGVELNGAISSIAHLAYHLGAIRQMDRSPRGPSEPPAG
jgi:hypothetical protein